MRLGGPVKVDRDPDLWAAALKAAGYSAAYLPGEDVPTALTYAAAAKHHDILLAENGAWSNPIDADDAKRQAAIEKCCRMLHIAEEAGAGCTVNIAGSRGPRWDGPDPKNLTEETFDLIVESVRTILDTVKPKRAFYSLETMPWIFPDSPDSYLALLRAIDRKQFGVHLDVVNMINCPSRAYRTGDFIRECFEKLGPQLKSCHLKDIRFAEDRHLTLHLDECRPGTGLIDFGTLLRELDKLDVDTPAMLEHLPSPEEYALAALHVRNVAADMKVNIQ